MAISAFGGLSVHVMASSRMLYVGARNGQFPEFLSHLSMDRLTPTPSLFFLVSLKKILFFWLGIDIYVTLCFYYQKIEISPIVYAIRI